MGLQLPEFIDVLPRATLDEVFIVYDVIRRESSVPATAGATVGPVGPRAAPPLT